VFYKAAADASGDYLKRGRNIYEVSWVKDSRRSGSDVAVFKNAAQLQLRTNEPFR
jgi:hypothetical protein